MRKKSVIKDKKKNEINFKLNIKNIISKKVIIYFIVAVLDLGMIIYCARRNILNYVTVGGKQFIVGGSKKLYFGRNYITVVITLFFYVYVCLLNKFILKEKKNEKYYVLLFVIITFVNILFFILFSRKVY